MQNLRRTLDTVEIAIVFLTGSHCKEFAYLHLVLNYKIKLRLEDMKKLIGDNEI